MAQGDLSPGNGDIACEHGLAGHQVVPAARAALLLGVITDIEQLPARIVERGKIHRVQQRVKTPLQRGFAPALQGRADGDKSRAEIAAVHGGDKARAQGAERARVVPVEKVTQAPLHALKRRQHVPEIGDGLLLWDHARRPQRRRRGQRQPDIGRGCAVRRADGRLLLEVVGREKMILRAREFPIVPPAIRQAAVQQVAVAHGEGSFSCRRQRQRRGSRGGQKPHESRRLSRGLGREGHQQYPQHDAGVHRPHMLGKGGGSAHLGKGRPLQKPFMAY